MDEIGFGELVGRMVWGTDAPDSIQGIVREVGGQTESLTRVTRAGMLSRRETVDGVVTQIVGREFTWFRDREISGMRVQPHGRSFDLRRDRAPIGGLEVGGHRPSWATWNGTDFTEPISPVEGTRFLDQDCYTVELAPPRHKPFPIRITVHAATGLVLRVVNRGFGESTEWTTLTIGEEIPDSTFEWDGPATPIPTHDESRAESEAERKARESEDHAWLDERGITTLVLPLQPRFTLHEHDDETGAVYASVDAQVDATLLRCGRSDEHWPEPDGVNYEQDYRWSDSRWDWYLATDQPLTEPQFTALRESLRDAT